MMTYTQNGQQACPQSSQSLPSLTEHQTAVRQSIKLKRRNCSFPSSVAQDAKAGAHWGGSQSVSPPARELQKSVQYPGATSKNRTFPSLEGEVDASKSLSKHRPRNS